MYMTFYTQINKSIISLQIYTPNHPISHETDPCLYYMCENSQLITYNAAPSCQPCSHVCVRPLNNYTVQKQDSHKALYGYPKIFVFLVDTINR